MRRRVETTLLRGLAVGLLTIVFSGCEIGGDRRFSVIAGPTVPSSVQTAIPYVWDFQEELSLWVNNEVTRGPVPMSLVEDGREAFIRIEPTRNVEGWLLRGPDLNPPPTATRAVRIWYRWRLDPTLSPNASRSFPLNATLEVLNPARPADQPRGSTTLQPTDEWTAASISFGPPGTQFDVRYVYFQQLGSNPGVFEIDRIEIVK
jgi:hypothetical protein